MPEEPNLLARTRPLADPLRMLARVMLTLALAAILTGALFLLRSKGIAGWPLLGAACTIFGCLLFFAVPFGEPNAIYLRAFRTDRETASLRAQLIAILGPKFRLSGIRPPRKHSSVFLRFLLPGFFVIRYGGSKFMELEAGDDWMARLWKTYQSVRIVFIDARDVTLYVHQEIRLTLQSVGTERCLFLIDNQKDIAAWRATLAEIVGPHLDPASFALLDVSPACIASGQVQAHLALFLRQLPANPPGENVSGRDFILQHVSEDILRESHRPSLMTIAGAVVGTALCLSSGFLLLPGVPQAIHVILTLLGFFVAVPLIFLLIFRSLARGVRLMRAHHGLAGLRAWLGLLAGFFLIGLGPGLSALQPIMQQIHDHPEQFHLRQYDIPHETGDESLAVEDVRKLYDAELQYYINFRADSTVTFACSLSDLGGIPKADEPPRPETTHAAQLIGDRFFSNNEEHYTFVVACVDDTGNANPTGKKFKILAISTLTGRKRGRSFCSGGSTDDIPYAAPGEYVSWNEHPVITYDPNGGSNCTEPVNWERTAPQ